MNQFFGLNPIKVQFPVYRSRFVPLGGLVLVTWFALFAFELTPACAQSEWVRRIDADGNGYIEPNEMSERARSFLSRFAGEYGIDLNSTQSVRRIEDAARQYFERRSRETTPPQAAPMPAIRGFGPIPIKPSFRISQRLKSRFHISLPTSPKPMKLCLDSIEIMMAS